MAMMGDVGPAGPAGPRALDSTVPGPQAQQALTGPAPWLPPTRQAPTATTSPALGLEATNYNLAAGGGSVIERTPPEPTASSDDVLQWDPDTKALARTFLHHGTAQVLTWERLPVDEVLAAHGVYAAVTYKGVLASQYPATVTNGDAYFVRLGSEWIRGIGGHWVGYLPPDGLGEFSYEADAAAAVTAVGQIATFPLEHISDHRVYPNRVTTFTAGPLRPAGFSRPSSRHPTAAEILLVTTAFDGNLDNTIVNVQDLAQAVDDLVVGSDDADDTPASPDSLPRAYRGCGSGGTLGHWHQPAGVDPCECYRQPGRIHRRGCDCEPSHQSPGGRHLRHRLHSLHDGLHGCDPFGDSAGDRRHQGGGGSDRLRTPFSVYYRDNTVTDEFYLSGSMNPDPAG